MTVHASASHEATASSARWAAHRSPAVVSGPVPRLCPEKLKPETELVELYVLIPPPPQGFI